MFNRFIGITSEIIGVVRMLIKDHIEYDDRTSPMWEDGITVIDPDAEITICPRCNERHIV